MRHASDAVKGAIVLLPKRQDSSLRRPRGVETRAAASTPSSARAKVETSAPMQGEIELDA